MIAPMTAIPTAMQDPLHHPQAPADQPGPIEQVAQLGAILALVEEMGGMANADPVPLADQSALRQAMAGAPDIARQRFEALIAEGAELASTGVRALLDRKANPAASRHLAGQLRAQLHRAAGLIGL